MSKFSYTPVSDEQLAVIERETAKSDEVEPRVVSARYDMTERLLVLNMKNGVTLLVPRERLHNMDNVTDEQLADVQVAWNGSILEWPAIDAQATVVALVARLFGITTASDVARRAAQTKSASRAAASRENGKKGGRPRKKEVV